VNLDLGVSGATISVEGNDFSVIETVLKVLDCFVELKAFNSLGDVIAVLVMSSQVSNSATSGYKKRKELECFDKMSN